MLCKLRQILIKAVKIIVWEKKFQDLPYFAPLCW